ncbi:MAG: hypothetical protein LCH81_15310 [Bacteroidetes bacterium]|nr:hypothetical protein [Bacteroidota bacterium]
MKKVITFLFLIFFNMVAMAQTNSLLGRWSGEHGTTKLTVVFAANGKGVWKATSKYDSSTGCICEHTASSPMKWKVKSDKIYIDLGTATGTYKMIQNDSKHVEIMKFCVASCESLLEVLKKDISDQKYSDDLLFEGKQKVWMLGIEFTKVVE